ncbi:Copine-8 [Entomortierella beljakovae]|nr:Copine-8 [Entomortierella beljakovae]
MYYVTKVNLVNRDGFGKSDPQVFIYLFDNQTNSWGRKPIGKTERIKDNLNPEFVKGVEMDYRFETVQRLRFVVYDIDEKDSDNFNDQDFQGEAVTELGNIFGARGNQIAIPLKHPRYPHLQNLGHIIIHAEELSVSKRVINFSLRAIDLTKKGLFKSRPSAFILIQRANIENTSFSPVYKSDRIESEDDPIWKDFTIKESLLCGGDPNRPFNIDIMSHKDNGSHTLIGRAANLTIAGLSKLTFPHSFPIPPMTNPSALVIKSFSVSEAPSFLDFITGGGTLGLCVAIDFTQSNGDPRNPQSLHYKSPTGENDYTRAIRSVCHVLQGYDTDKKFPVFGFGGRINGQVSHAFALNGNPSNPEVYGVEGILGAYWQAQSFVELYGPTNFAPVIMEATNIAKQSQPRGYTTLLILTDGAITDMEATSKAIQKASKNALSIVIVGVGYAKFSNMNDLDGDGELRKKGRDIVQFVAAREYLPQREYALAEALLAELPDQFMDYMNSNKIKPPPPVRVDTAAALEALYHTTPQHQIPAGFAPPGSAPPPGAHAYLPPGSAPAGAPGYPGAYAQPQQYNVYPPQTAGVYPTPVPIPGQTYNPAGQHYPPHPAAGPSGQYPPQYPLQAASVHPGQAFAPQFELNGVSHMQSPVPTYPAPAQHSPIGSPSQVPQHLYQPQPGQVGADGSLLRPVSPSFPMPQLARAESPSFPVPQLAQLSINPPSQCPPAPGQAYYPPSTPPPGQAYPAPTVPGGQTYSAPTVPGGQTYSAPAIPPPGQAYPAPTVPGGQIYSAPAIPPPGQAYPAPTIPPPGQTYSAPAIPPPGQTSVARDIPPSTTEQQPAVVAKADLHTSASSSDAQRSEQSEVATGPRGPQVIATNN